MKSTLFFAAMLSLSACATQPKPVLTEPARPQPATVPVATATASKPGTEASSFELSCTLHKDRRLITVVPKDAGCELHYNKNSGSSVVARSVNSSDYCEAVRTRMRKNLESAGFACK